MSETPTISSASNLPANTQDKIKSLDELSKLVDREQSEGRRVVHCHGVFDLIHLGHIRHFQQARSFGDMLIVTITPDPSVNKGAHRPAFPEKLRAETIAALSIVDYVAINQWPTAVETLELLKPDVYCKGNEYRKNQVDAKSNMLREIATAETLNIQMAYTDDIVFSSSVLLNQKYSPFPPETDAWLSTFRIQHKTEDVLKYLDDIHGLKVLVVGEAIIDEYVFVQAIGKSTKDPVLACRHQYSESFGGGSLAVANHLADFCEDVALVTFIAEINPRKVFIEESLDDRIKRHFVTKKTSPTIVKRRYIDEYTKTKLFEIYEMNDEQLCDEDEASFIETLNELIDSYDVVVTADYGHGMLTSRAVATLCDKSKFLAVNTQSNAGNQGFNPISKYPRADYVCLAMHEIQMETRMRGGAWRDLILEVTKRIDCKQFTVTRGSAGSIHYSSDGRFTEAPSMALHVADRVGAGDAVLALTSLLVSIDVPWDIVGFIGNVAGAHMVTDLGNRNSLNKTVLSKNIISLMK